MNMTRRTSALCCYLHLCVWCLIGPEFGPKSKKWRKSKKNLLFHFAKVGEGERDGRQGAQKTKQFFCPKLRNDKYFVDQML
jgi:hypothetical protein